MALPATITTAHQRHDSWPGDWIAAYPDYAAPAITIPAAIAPAYSIAPRCTPAVETVTVPSEEGGERKITIKRC